MNHAITRPPIRPPPLPQAFLSRVLGFAQAGAILAALGGERIAEAAGVALPPQYVAALREKRMAIVMGVWFVGNMINNSLISTGAFEVFANGQLVFSKLATGQMPTLAEIMAGVQNALGDAAQQ